MSLIQLRALGVLSPRPLFQNLDLSIHPGQRIGLVAANGAGKTTLLRAIAGELDPTEGDIIRRRALLVATVPQHIPENLLPLPLDETLRRALPPGERETNGWKADLILDQLETPETLRPLKLAELSGGWQRLALIARAWLTEPDLMLLDEPTNHLDLDRLAILENWIAHATEGVAMLIASHDRAFLDHATTHTLFLRPEESRLYAHPYSAARALLEQDDAARDARAARDQKAADRLRRNAGQLKNVGINSGSDLLLKKAKYLTHRADALEQTIRATPRERAPDLRLANRGTHAKILVTLDDLAIAAPDGRPLFRTGKLTLHQHERLVIAGPNGAGKSQFLALLRRAILGGEAIPGIAAAASLAPFFMDQHMSLLPERDTPHAWLSGHYRQGDQRTLSLLAGAGFDVETQRRPIGQLSGGQKSRLALLALRLENPNFYLLDEPTNHLDIAGQEKLEEEILAHDASCVLVSHDRAFLSAIGTRCLRIDKGKLREEPLF